MSEFVREQVNHCILGCVPISNKCVKYQALNNVGKNFGACHQPVNGIGVNTAVARWSSWPLPPVSLHVWHRVLSFARFLRRAAPGSAVWMLEGIGQYDSSDTGHSDNVNIAAEHQEPAEVLSQLDNTSNSPVYGEYKCC